MFAAPRLKRIDPSVRAWGRPIAFSTCDGSSVPDEHADPDDTAMPARSRPISSDSASTRSMLMLVVFGTRGDAAPLRSVPGIVDEDARLEAIAQRAPAAALRSPASPRDLRGDAEADQRRHVLGARAAAALLPPAGDRRDQAHAALDPQRAGALGPVELVTRDRQQVDAERAHVDRNLAGALHRVGVKQRAALVRDRGELRDRLDGADLVVGVHHRDERGVVGDRLAQRDRSRRCRWHRPARS